MNLQDLLNNPPVVHKFASGEPHSVGLRSEVLYFIDQHVGETSKTLETGAGISTVLFALKGTDHTCIVPYQYEVDRIKEYCAQHQISTYRINFQVDRSENVLPRLKPSELDLVLIDGSHGFPAPFIDWYYTVSGLKVGGTLVIDDTHVWTGEVLKKFLFSEPEWKLQEDFSLRTAAFIKLEEGSHLKEWDQQEYVMDQSRDSMKAADGLLKADDLLKIAKEPDPNGFLLRGKRAMTLLLKGEILTLAKKIIKNTVG